jgi:hypothetical protein
VIVVCAGLTTIAGLLTPVNPYFVTFGAIILQVGGVLLPVREISLYGRLRGRIERALKRRDARKRAVLMPKSA